MENDERGTGDDEFLLSLTRYHALLSAVPAEARPDDMPPLPGSASSRRLRRAQDCLRLLHSTWNEEKPESVPFRPSEVTESVASPEPRGPNGQRVQVGRFEIVRELGRGAFGIVFLAIDPVLGREVALKLPRPEAVFTPGYRRRFVREAQAAAAVSHPNLVSVYESGEWGPACYIATEYCAGQTLAAWLFHRAERVPPALAATLVASLARALDYAHDHGIIHRDLKPSNVMLVPKAGSDALAPFPDNRLEFVPKITDFGLAKLEKDAYETRSTALVGTPVYMSPEQAEPGLGEVSRQTDVYALGVILYEMLVGRPPFAGTSDIETLRRVALDEPERPRRLRRGLPRDLEAICLKCLEKTPAARYATAADLADDLTRFLTKQPTLARPLGPMHRSLKWIRRRPAVAAVLGIVVLTGLSAWANSWWQAASLREALAINTRFRLQAEDERRTAQDQARRVQGYHYVADMTSALDAWRMARVSQAVELLARNRPKSGQEDRRSFVWHYLWRLCHDGQVTLRGHENSVYSVSFSRDGKRLATASADGTARLWDIESGQTLATFRGHTGDVNMANLSPDGRWLATAGDDRTVRLWSVSPPALRFTGTGHPGEVHTLAFSPDGKTLASGSEDGTVIVWETAAGRRLTSLDPRTGSVRDLAFSPDGRLLAIAGRDGVCRLWDMSTGRVRRQFNSPEKETVECILFSHDGRTLAAGGAGSKVRLWEIATGAERSTFSAHSETVSSVSFAPDDRTLAASVRDGTVWRWDVATGRPLSILMSHSNCVWDVKYSPDGRTLAIASADGTVKLWDANADQTHKTIADVASAPTALVFSPDSRQVAAVIPDRGGDRTSFRAWDVRTGAECKTGLDLDGGLGSMTAANGNLLAGRITIHGDRLGIRVLRGKDQRWVSTSYVLNPLPSERPVAMVCLAISPGGRLLATGHAHGKVTLWSLDTGRELATMEPEKGHSVCAVRFNPDGTLLASASRDGSVRLWNVGTGAERATLLGHLGEPRTAAFSPEGTYLATAGADRTVKIWDTATGSELATLARQAGEVRALVFSPDSKTLASGGDDGAIKLWDVATWQELISLDAHRGGVQSIAFSPDGRVLAASGADGQGRGEIFLWTAGPSDDN
jgi:eukaryotic-like serine/threonine-protein kinase